MTSLYHRLLGLLITGIFSAPLQLFCQDNTQLDHFILRVMKKNAVTGLSALVIKDGKIIWTKGYGYANVEKNIPFTPLTVNAEIASLSKTVTATAIMQLWEQKKLGLDDNVNDYLPYKVINPYFPTVPITFRMLLNHTSSLYTGYNNGSDKYDFNSQYFPKLGDYLYGILNVCGDYYIDSVAFRQYKPGAAWNYCGSGYALLGYLLELISRTPFDEYCRQHIFLPLGMNNTAWHFRDVDTNIVSRPYHNGEKPEAATDYGLYEYPTYPEGQLKSSVTDLAKFLWMNMNDGLVGDSRILKSSTIKLMRTNSVPISDSNFLNAFYGLGWAHIQIDGEEYWGHHGRNIGISSEILYNYKKKTGVIVLANSEANGCTWIPCMNEEDIMCSLFYAADTIAAHDAFEISPSYSYSIKVHDLQYWKANLLQWPAGALPMKLGTLNLYDREHLFALLTIKNDNVWTALTDQLIIAKMNVANGCNFSSVSASIDLANKLISVKHLPMVTEDNVQPEVRNVTQKLREYNVGSGDIHE
jgi:CubicO group peptidase (beta-lactamase class C family)